ncbi:MAG: hypothetical protein WAM82_20300 [Thermoanaerobaculia bacterium]
MTQLLGVEALIAGKEGWVVLFEKKPGEVFVFDAFPTDVPADKERSDSPTTQELPLALRDVLIQDDHKSGSS